MKKKSNSQTHKQNLEYASADKPRKILEALWTTDKNGKWTQLLMNPERETQYFTIPSFHS